MDNLVLVGLRVLVLLFAGAVFFGFGALLCRREPGNGHLPAAYRFSLVSTVGLGVFIVLIQLLAIFGWFNIVAITVLAAIGVTLAFIAARAWTAQSPLPQPLSFAEKSALVVLIAVVLRTVLMPFSPATEWDEVMYHLPHARQWAESGSLTVNHWLRFAWFPYNFDLLYAIAMLFSDEVMAHLFHAYAGWLCALMVYQVMLQLTDRLQAMIAAIIWMSLSDNFYGSAMIELGLSLFLFAACVAFWQWVSDRRVYRQWLYLAAFLLGVAAGSKYLPLVYLPLFALALLIIERRLMPLLVSAACFLAPCVYWYTRNFLLTGDPFNPFGAAVFGYTDWSASDIAGQFNYTSSHSGWPPWLLWPALIAIFNPATWKHTGWRMAAIFAVWALVSWYFLTGGYVRFLVPAYPLLAILAARGWTDIFVAVRGRFDRSSQVAEVDSAGHRARPRIILTVLIVISAGFAIEKLVRDWNDIQASDTRRETYLLNTITGYEVISQLQDIEPAGIYQFGLEDSIYYFPQPVWGDHFGSMRYTDLAALSAGLLAKKLKSRDIGVLVINQANWPQIESKDGFHQYFEQIAYSGQVSAYRLR